MKSEWLKDLKEQAQFDDPAGYVGEPNRTEWYLLTGSLRALVTEREALLEALNIFVVLSLLPSVTKGDMDAARQNAEAAIAKAEAP